MQTNKPELTKIYNMQKMLKIRVKWITIIEFGASEHEVAMVGLLVVLKSIGRIWYNEVHEYENSRI